MNKIITAYDSYGEMLTCLRRIGDDLWEWDGMGVSESRIKAGGERDPKHDARYDDDGMLLRVPYNTLDREGLQSYIDAMKMILEEKWDCFKHEDLKEYPIKWKTNDAKVKISAFFAQTKQFIISLSAQNKYRQNWNLEETIDRAMHDCNNYDPSWHGSDDSWAGNTLMITEDGLKKYIAELEEEIGAEPKSQKK